LEITKLLVLTASEEACCLLGILSGTLYFSLFCGPEFLAELQLLRDASLYWEEAQTQCPLPTPVSHFSRKIQAEEIQEHSPLGKCPATVETF